MYIVNCTRELFTVRENGKDWQEPSPLGACINQAENHDLENFKNLNLIDLVIETISKMHNGNIP